MNAGDPMQGSGAGREPTEEELRAALAEQMRQVRVEQVVTEATVSILNVAVMRAGLVPGSEGERDLAQTRMGIEAVRALLPVVEQALGAEQTRQIRDALSQLQMAYAQAVQSGGAAPAAEPGAPGAGAPAASPSAAGSPAAPASESSPGERPADGPGPAQRSGRLWVPGQ